MSLNPVYLKLMYENQQQRDPMRCALTITIRGQVLTPDECQEVMGMVSDTHGYLGTINDWDQCGEENEVFRNTLEFAFEEFPKEMMVALSTRFPKAIVTAAWENANGPELGVEDYVAGEMKYQRRELDMSRNDHPRDRIWFDTRQANRPRTERELASSLRH